MKEFSLHFPETKEEFIEYYFLRWKILRKPLSKKKGTEKDNIEKDSFHVYIKNKINRMVAVGRIHIVKNMLPKTAQIRFMAVDDDFQGLGLGSMILRELESQAKREYAYCIILHAREMALDFYKKNGYIVEEKSHLLFNEVQHWLMEKKI